MRHISILILKFFYLSEDIFGNVTGGLFYTGIIFLPAYSAISISFPNHISYWVWSKLADEVAVSVWSLPSHSVIGVVCLSDVMFLHPWTLWVWYPLVNSAKHSSAISRLLSEMLAEFHLLRLLGLLSHQGQFIWSLFLFLNPWLYHKHSSYESGGR